MVVVALLPFVVIGGPGAGWLRDLGLLGRNEKFTELYFPDRRALPLTVTVGAPMKFDFTLHNREAAAKSYRWKVVLTSGGTDVDLARGRVRLDDGEIRRISVATPTPEPPGPAVVRVMLVAREESIQFPITIVPVADVSPAPAG